MAHGRSSGDPESNPRAETRALRGREDPRQSAAELFTRGATRPLYVRLRRAVTASPASPAIDAGQGGTGSDRDHPADAVSPEHTAAIHRAEQRVPRNRRG